MSSLTIEKDIEFIKNQVNYLDTFQKRISKAVQALKSQGVYKSGFAGDELIFTEITRWLKSYSTLKTHLIEKKIIDTELREALLKLPELQLIIPENSKVLIAQKGAFVKVAYSIFPFYRSTFNKKQVNLVKGQIEEYKKWGNALRKISYGIERVYTEGI